MKTRWSIENLAQNSGLEKSLWKKWFNPGWEIQGEKFSSEWFDPARVDFLAADWLRAILD